MIPTSDLDREIVKYFRNIQYNLFHLHIYKLKLLVTVIRPMYIVQSSLPYQHQLQMIYTKLAIIKIVCLKRSHTDVCSPYYIHDI